MKDKSEQHELQLLIEAVINEEASAEQHRQLEKRLLDDEQARTLWLDYANLHASLKRRFLAGATAEPSEEDIADWRRQTRQYLEQESRGFRYSSVALALAVCVLIVASVLQLPQLRALIDGPERGPTIVQLAGDVQIRSVAGKAVEATNNYTVALGETILSLNEEDRVKLRYPDGTTIVVLGNSAMTVVDSPVGGKQLHLERGLLQADVTPQASKAPLMIVTPQTRVRVLGTRFELATDAQAGTRLDLEEGEVELVRNTEQPIKIEPNSIAIVPSSADPIRVSPRPTVVDTPQRETTFKGLKSIAFSGNGTSLIAGTTWQAVYWHQNDRLQAIPLEPRGRKGIHLRHQVNSLLTYSDQPQQCLKTWNARSQQSQTVFSDIAKLRKQFRSTPDRQPNWNPLSRLTVVSPEANWLAFQAGREFRIYLTANDAWADFAKRYDGKFVSALAASPNGKTVAVAVRRDRLDLVDVNTGKVNKTWSLRNKVPFAVGFSADGKTVALGLAGHVAVYSVASGEVLGTFEQTGLPFLRIALSAEGRFVAASTQGGRVWIWDVTKAAELPLLAVGDPIQDLTFAPNDTSLAVLSPGGRLTVWDAAPEESEKQISQTTTN